MIQKRTSSTAIAESEVLLKVLTAELRVLTIANGSEEVLTLYSSFLRFLKSQPAEFWERALATRHEARAVPPPSTRSTELLTMGLEELQAVITDESISRRDLERVAIERFSVPAGSMRSFSRRPLLVQKLRSLIENERAHEIIGAVARGDNGLQE